MLTSRIVVRCTLVALMAALPQASRGAEPFYKGKTITTLVWAGAGGGYDLVARTVARYLPNYIAGAPSVIVQNMPGDKVDIVYPPDAATGEAIAPKPR